MTELRSETRPVAAPVTTLSGVDALVRLLVLRHELDRRDGLDTATMVSGYPGSPLGTFDLAVEQARDLLDAHRVRHQPGLNEELAAAIVWGSQMGAAVPYKDVDGVAGAWYGKGPGLDRSGDSLKHGNAMGSGPNGGVVLFCGDDPMSKSSTLPCDSQYTFCDACIPVLVPADQQDIIDLGIHGFRLSRYAGCWVGLKIVTSVADGIGSVDLDLGRHTPMDPPGLLVDGSPWQHHPLARVGPHAVPDQEILMVHARLEAAKGYAVHNGLDRVIGAPPGARLGIVCSGTAYLAVVGALAERGIHAERLAESGIRILRLAMTYPLVESTVRTFAGSVDELVVVEEKRPFVETQLRAVLHEAGLMVPVSGKRDREGKALFSEIGELDVDAVGAGLERAAPSAVPPSPRRSAAVRHLSLVEPPGRAPAFCSGCPHNRSTVFPAGALVGGGVGCHGIIYFEARHRGMQALPATPMGAEGVPWIGLSPFVDQPHLIQNLGDGTLSHSGSLAIRAAVAAGANVTYKILYNSAVAMTGGQDVTGLMDVPSLTRALEAEGVARVVVCAEDPGHYGRHARWAAGVEVLGRDRLDEVQARLREVPGVTVLVYDQRCAAESRRLRRRGLLAEPPRRVFINEAVCEGCGDCGVKSNCLSVVPVDTEFGEKRQVHDPSCNRDYTCLEGDCPSFLTLEPARRGRRRPPTTAAPPAAGGAAVPPLPPAEELPSPAAPAIDGAYGIYFTGIGGTGVVTANRILARAAELSGMGVAGLDQTGLSQKAGAVVSHLHFATDRSRLGTASVGSGGADLYLSGDILQAASPRHLARVRPGSTLAVVDRDFTPTASMLQSGTGEPGGLEDAVREAVGPGRVAFIDAKVIAERIFANHLLANVILLGAAYQLGGLPLPLQSLEQAIGKQGKAAADNWSAFLWGRWAVHDPVLVAQRMEAAEETTTPGHPFDPSPGAVRQAAGQVKGRPLPAELTGLLERRAAQVVDYQNVRLAARYLDLVEQVAAADDAAHDWAMTGAVAEGWFKLLTYKDEYEVARLHLAIDTDHVARQLGIEGPYKVTYHLHPPVLRRMGLRHKLPMGRPYRAAFVVLRRMKRLRGSALDVFGADRDRRMERALIDEYHRLVTSTLSGGPTGGSPGDYDRAVRLFESVGMIKGYGPVKEAAVERWRNHLAEIERAEEPAPV